MSYILLRRTDRKKETAIMLLQKGDTAVFWDDSITDYYMWLCPERDHTGFGYYMLTSAFLQANYPHMDFTFYNRAHAEHSTVNLLRHVEEYCISLKPNLVVILVGINDSIKRFNGSNIFVSPEQFK